MHFHFSHFRRRDCGEQSIIKCTMEHVNNGSFVSTSNETSTTTDVGNSTDTPFDQTSGSPAHDDTVSVVLIPLVIIGLLLALAAIVSDILKIISLMIYITTYNFTQIFIVIRRRTTKQARRQFAPVYYSVEHEESGNEWESQLMDEELARHANIVKVGTIQMNYTNYPDRIFYFCSQIVETKPDSSLRRVALNRPS